jgi:hypothetical protein
MTVRFFALGLVLLLAACGGQAGMKCDYAPGNLDAIKSQVAGLKAGGTTAAEVKKQLGEPNSVTPGPDGGKVYEYDFPQPLSASSSPACPEKTQKVAFTFDAKDILRSMQIIF